MIHQFAQLRLFEIVEFPAHHAHAVHAVQMRLEAI